MKITDQEALDYHSVGRPGKLEVIASKPCFTQRDLSIAYTPGVAVPCLVIEKNPDDAYKYTGKGNLVAVISNGTAVLGLGDIGALAGKPVMEGKGVLFKRFAGVDVFDIEINTKNPDEVIQFCKLIEPTLGGINLEDIKAPECFYIEEKLKEMLNIPVFHDDQHGTAIISGAALLNALELVGKKAGKVKCVFSGAGAAGIACAKMYMKLGVSRENIILVDTKGVVYKGRTQGMNPYKEEFAIDTNMRSLDDAMKGADVFVGVSVKDLVTPEMLKSMADHPIVFAMANPDPEITFELARETRKDVIMATGRSDYPNQVNNVLGFPFIFRGALDVHASAINDEMKIAASHALADLAKEDVPDSVIRAYGGAKLRFGPDYIIPKPFDPRVLLWEASAVARAAVESGVARRPIKDFDAYRERLENMLGRSREVMRIAWKKAKEKRQRIVLPEGTEDKVLRACQILREEQIAEPIVLGSEKKITERIASLGLELDDLTIVDPTQDGRRERYVQALYDLRKLKGMTQHRAKALIEDPTIFGMMMLHSGDADGLVSGLNKAYPDTIRPALQIISLRDDVTSVCGVYMMVLKNRILFFADTTVNIDPTPEKLAEIAILTAELAKRFAVEPRVAMLSFSNFGSVEHPQTEKVRKAVEIMRQRRPDILVEGEMHADAALVPEVCQSMFPHSKICGDATVLVFPDLNAGNIGYKLVRELSDTDAVGPILLGMRKPINVLNYYSTVDDIVNTIAVTSMMCSKPGECK
jgi:malate dehydrogenase (oxaloacetate-decarboxylating)(NADP+)